MSEHRFDSWFLPTYLAIAAALVVLMFLSCLAFRKPKVQQSEHEAESTLRKNHSTIINDSETYHTTKAPSIKPRPKVPITKNLRGSAVQPLDDYGSQTSEESQKAHITLPIDGTIATMPPQEAGEKELAEVKTQASATHIDLEEKLRGTLGGGGKVPPLAIEGSVPVSPVSKAPFSPTLTPKAKAPAAPTSMAPISGVSGSETVRVREAVEQINQRGLG